MMKRLSKAALLAAAAFMLTGIPACSNDDGGENEEIKPPVESGEDDEKDPPKETVEEPSEPGGAYETLADGTAAGRIATTAPEAAGTITLYKNDESQGTKSSVAEALEAIDKTGTDNWRIELTPGTYEATGLNYKGSANITIAGKSDKEYGTDVLIVGKGSDMTQESTRSLLSFEGSAHVVIKNLTLRNSHCTTAGTAQSETIGVGKSEFNGTFAAYNCSFLSGQDTICTEGKAWFYKCYIEGDVDFIWLESKGGKVALYEECIIRAIGTRTTNAYFTAPRLAVANTVGKGVVIWNSTLQAEDGLKNVYLGRNPWDKETDELKGTDYFKDYYEQVAIVGTKFYSTSTVSLNPEIWKGSGAHGTENQQFVGFKTDAYFAKSTKAAENGARRLTAAQVEAEYSDRNKILNRVYNIAEEKFENESESNIWDTAALAEEFKASASSDLEQEPFDSTSAKVVWDLASAWTDDAGKSSIQNSTTKGILPGKVEGSDEHTVKMFIDANVNSQGGKFVSQQANGRTQINMGTILTVPVTDGAIVSVTKNSGTFGIEGEERTTYTHSGDPTGIVIYCTANGYLTEVTVSKLDLTALSDDLKNATVTGKVRAMGLDHNDFELMNGLEETIKATAYTSYGATPGTISWSSESDSVATVENGKVSARSDSGTAKITATCDSVSASCTVTMLPAVAVDLTKAEVTWDLTSSSINIQGKTGTIDGRITGSNKIIKATVDATVASGKLQGDGTQHAQFNAGTKITIPVSKGCTVTVTATSAGAKYALYTIKGTAAKTDNKVSTYTHSDEDESTEIDIISTGTAYIASIVISDLDATSLAQDAE